MARDAPELRPLVAQDAPEWRPRGDQKRSRMLKRAQRHSRIAPSGCKRRSRLALKRRQQCFRIAPGQWRWILPNCAHAVGRDAHELCPRRSYLSSRMRTSNGQRRSGMAPRQLQMTLMNRAKAVATDVAEWRWGCGKWRSPIAFMRRLVMVLDGAQAVAGDVIEFCPSGGQRHA